MQTLFLCLHLSHNFKYDKNADLIFTRENGLYIGTDLTRYPFKVIHQELGLEKCRFYDLRGSYATKILNNGIENCILVFI